MVGVDGGVEGLGNGIVYIVDGIEYVGCEIDVLGILEESNVREVDVFDVIDGSSCNDIEGDGFSFMVVVKRVKG